MAVRLRLTRIGGRKDPVWRVVVADQRSPRDGRVIEIVGHYNAQTDPSTIKLDSDRIQHWLDRGAQPSGTVKQLVRAQRKSGGPTAVAGPPAPPEAAVATEDEAAPEAEAPTDVEAADGAEAPEADAAPEDSGDGEAAAPESAGDAPDAGEDDSSS